MSWSASSASSRSWMKAQQSGLARSRTCWLRQASGRRPGRPDPDSRRVTRVRLDVYPDGGMARLRLIGRLTPDGLADLTARWRAATPSSAAAISRGPPSIRGPPPYRRSVMACGSR